MKKKNNKGFTLAEMLIVVAIIGVLVAIMVPTFTSQVENAREKTDIANIRAIISDQTVVFLQGGTATLSNTYTITAADIEATSIGGATLKACKKGDTITVTVDATGVKLS